MLGAHPIDVMLLSTDLHVTKQFYRDQIGLDVVLEQEDLFVSFKCGGDSRLVVTKSTVGTSDEQTQASWRVEDLSAEVAELRSRGVEFVDMPEYGSVDGIADVGFAFTAAFVDPHRNSIGLLQVKPEVGASV